MDMTAIVTPERVFSELAVTAKKQLLEHLAAEAARATGLHERTIFDALLERERLGSTGVGHGVAIPHGRLAGLSRLHGFFAKLQEPIDFEAADGRPVDLVFLLLAPEGSGGDHLKALGHVSRLLRDPQACATLRAAVGRDRVYALLVEGMASKAA